MIGLRPVHRHDRTCRALEATAADAVTLANAYARQFGIRAAADWERYAREMLDSAATYCTFNCTHRWVIQVAE